MTDAPVFCGQSSLMACTASSSDSVLSPVKPSCDMGVPWLVRSARWLAMCRHSSRTASATAMPSGSVRKEQELKAVKAPTKSCGGVSTTAACKTEVGHAWGFA